MNIYLITQKKCTGYDTYDSAIVIAKSGEEAKKIHPDGKGDITKERFFWYENWPQFPKDVTAVKVGESTYYKKPQVLLASFNPG